MTMPFWLQLVISAAAGIVSAVMGIALVPFLTQSFSKIYLCDFRYFDRNAISFLEEVGATDVLFAMSSVAVTSSGKVDKVADLMK